MMAEIRTVPGDLMRPTREGEVRATGPIPGDHDYPNGNHMTESNLLPPELPDLAKLEEQAANAVMFWEERAHYAQEKLDNARAILARLTGMEPEPTEIDDPLPEPPKRERSLEERVSAEVYTKVLEALAGHSYATRPTVAQSCRLSVSTVGYALRLAEERGHVETWNRARPKGTHPGKGKQVYKILDTGREFVTRPDEGPSSPEADRAASETGMTGQP
jgi:hypothetical protein